MVSIVMPSYNTGRFISESIQSIIDQTYENWELLIVDDHSEDDTAEKVKRFSDSRIKYYEAKKNRGAAACRNKALQEVQGRWIAFLDSDDLWYPDKLRRQIDFMVDRNIAFSYTAYEKIDEESRGLNVYVSGPRKICKMKMYDYCWPGCLTVMFDSRILSEKLQVNNIRKNNDYAMWLVLTRYAECYLLNEILAKYRVRNGSISSEKYISLIKWHYKLFREAENLNAMKSFCFTIRNMYYGIVKKLIYQKSYK